MGYPEDPFGNEFEGVATESVGDPTRAAGQNQLKENQSYFIQNSGPMRVTNYSDVGAYGNEEIGGGIHYFQIILCGDETGRTVDSVGAYTVPHDTTPTPGYQQRVITPLAVACRIKENIIAGAVDFDAALAEAVERMPGGSHASQWSTGGSYWDGAGTKASQDTGGSLNMVYSEKVGPTYDGTTTGGAKVDIAYTGSVYLTFHLYAGSSTGNLMARVVDATGFGSPNDDIFGFAGFVLISPALYTS